MIKKLHNQNIEVSKEIKSLFQTSYRIEAKLLGVVDFPPLNRTLIDFVNTKTDFIGYCLNQKIVAVVELLANKNSTDIHSLVVHPTCFRQGIAKKLLLYIFKQYDAERFTVETGLKNEPALNLYRQLGFEEQSQWDTDFGVRKVGLVRIRSTI